MAVLFVNYVWDHMDGGKLESSRLSLLHYMQISTIVSHYTSLGDVLPFLRLLYQTSDLSFGII
jgi:hypothetical protein